MRILGDLQHYILPSSDLRAGHIKQQQHQWAWTRLKLQQRFPGADAHFQSAFWTSHSAVHCLSLAGGMNETYLSQRFSHTQAVSGPEELDITLALALHLFPPKPL